MSELNSNNHHARRGSDMGARRALLPPDMIPFILANRDNFDVWIEDDERIIIAPKAGARAHLDMAPPAYLTPTPERKTVAPLRPKFTYTVTHRDYNPEHAKAFGMSKPRLRVYEIVYAAGSRGIRYRGVREASGLQHGSVMQILHWLRKQNLITGTPEQF